MSKELVKYGFVYIWFDRKHKRYYIGSHWGNPNDGYICSSDNMKHNYKNRSQDFKRRILKRIYTNRLDLLHEEQRWLDMVPKHKFGFQYYNISNTTNKASWWSNEETKKQVSEKLKANHWSKNEETKKQVSDKIANHWSKNEETRKQLSDKHSEIMKRKICLRRNFSME